MVTEHEVPRLLEFIMDTVIEIAGAERGFLILSPHKKEASFKINVARNLDQETIEKPTYKVSRTIVKKVLEAGKPLLTTDAASDPRLQSSQSIQGLKLKSLLCVPLTNKGRVIGAIYVENRFQKGLFTQDTLEILSAFADQAALALENARLYEENHRKTDKIEKLNEQLSQLLAHKEVELTEAQEKISHGLRVLERKYAYDKIIGVSPAMQRVFEVLDRVTEGSISVLITGESGTGKELIARALHFNSPRKNAEFVAINCSAIPGQLLESELFGHVRGAFTGAERDKKGLFELAHGGTLFLDEIGDMPLELQPKLLRVLESREIRKVGSHQKISVDVRIVSATHQDLKELCRKKSFREDLYYRLNGVMIPLPPLRERRGDIPSLVRFLLDEMAGAKKIKVTAGAMRLLTDYDWPGNIRELRNELERALSFGEKEILPAHLSDSVGRENPRIVPTSGGLIREGRNLYEKEAILEAVRRSAGNKVKAAKRLGISRVALYQKIKKLGIMAQELQS
ncbi:MAG: hypothetical protein A2048_00335 [Deltaproteobacteria bacterium GWA2_45_12]|nr:MAG: hypothetical protein A2048_00335 [Deltaproteobacteria bacterium GWA2_45_12]